MNEKKTCHGSIKFSTIEKCVTILTGLASLATIFSIVYVIVQLRDIKRNEYSHSVQIMGVFVQQFYSGANPDVRHAISSGGPILKENGGSITDGQLEDYLDIYETISDAYDRKLIDDEMLYIYESNYIKKAYQNDEIRDYIAEVRKEDPDFYTGFEALARKFLKQDDELPESEIKNI